MSEAPAHLDPVERARARLKQGREAIAQRFDAGEAVERLLAAQAALVDELVLSAWDDTLADADGLSLLATGGYGRGEQYPFSDVDLLVLGEESAQARHESAIAAFVARLWDIGLKPGHAVRSLSQCAAAAADATVLTSLLELRGLRGDLALPARLAEVVCADVVFEASAYLEAKRGEWAARHARHDNTANNLEPNIKEGPGGLRDLHTLNWLALRLYRVPNLAALVPLGLLGEDESASLQRDWRIMARLRFGLHLTAGRREERLRFDFQKALAERLGYRDEHADNLAVEQMMQSLFQAAHTILRVSERLLQRFEEQLAGAVVPQPLDEEFELRLGYLRHRRPGLLLQGGMAVLGVFERWAQCPQARGLHSETARALAEALPNILPYESQPPELRRRVIQLIHSFEAVPTLRRMAHLGVLSRYLPAFGKVAGRMQYDLFHVYTVDQHTLAVLQIMASFATGADSRFPKAAEVYARLRHPGLLLLAGLFHDIAKGRGGDHSALGAVDARAFGEAHDLPETSVALVAWLVQEHLLMSTTAQRQDIGDASVVARFAERVGSLDRLDHLYLLTCADIAGTSPKLWNTWKERLLGQLLDATRRVLMAGDGVQPDDAQRVAEMRDEVAGRLPDLVGPALQQVLAELPDESFLRYRADQLAWQVRGILGAEPGRPTVLVRGEAGGFEVFVHSPDREGLFAILTATLERLGFSVVSARIVTSRSGMTLDTLEVLPVLAFDETPERIAAHAAKVIAEMLARPAAQWRPVRRATPAALRHFRVQPRVDIVPGCREGRTQLMLTGADRPGLLADIARVLRENRFRVHDARIATFGERVEDSFLISDLADAAVDDPTILAALRASLLSLLEGDPHVPPPVGR